MLAFTNVRGAFSSWVSSRTFKIWASRFFLVSIAVYLVVLGYLIVEAVSGASKWAPYGVNIPIFVTLIILSEAVMTVTGVLIFREAAGIWPESVLDGWQQVKTGSFHQGFKKLLIGAWDIEIINLRLRTGKAILYGRLNRLSALVPLVYALAFSFGKAPWGLVGSAMIDVLITLLVWVIMEVVMVRPEKDKVASLQTNLADSTHV